MMASGTGIRWIGNQKFYQQNESGTREHGSESGDSIEWCHAGIEMQVAPSRDFVSLGVRHFLSNAKLIDYPPEIVLSSEANRR
jgi:hypothetical protein